MAQQGAPFTQSIGRRRPYDSGVGEGGAPSPIRTSTGVPLGFPSAPRRSAINPTTSVGGTAAAPPSLFFSATPSSGVTTDVRELQHALQSAHNREQGLQQTVQGYQEHCEELRAERDALRTQSDGLRTMVGEFSDKLAAVLRENDALRARLLRSERASALTEDGFHDAAMTAFHRPLAQQQQQVDPRSVHTEQTKPCSSRFSSVGGVDQRTVPADADRSDVRRTSGAAAAALQRGPAAPPTVVPGGVPHRTTALQAAMGLLDELQNSSTDATVKPVSY